MAVQIFYFHWLPECGSLTNLSSYNFSLLRDNDQIPPNPGFCQVFIIPNGSVNKLWHKEVLHIEHRAFIKYCAFIFTVTAWNWITANKSGPVFFPPQKWRKLEGIHIYYSISYSNMIYTQWSHLILCQGSLEGSMPRTSNVTECNSALSEFNDKSGTFHTALLHRYWQLICPHGWGIFCSFHKANRIPFILIHMRNDLFGVLLTYRVFLDCLRHYLQRHPYLSYMGTYLQGGAEK